MQEAQARTASQKLSAGDARLISLCPDREQSKSDRSGNANHRVPRTPSLPSLAIPWFHRHGWLAVLREIRGSYHRIRLLLETRWDISGLVYEEVRASLPRVDFATCPTEIHACSRGIQALEKVRPYLGLSDLELFEQGWFQAIEYVLHIQAEGRLLHIDRQTLVASNKTAEKSRPGSAVPQCSKHDLSPSQAWPL
jgi:hypothetical protein